MNQNKIFLILLILLQFTGILFSQNSNNFIAKDGVLDLRLWDYNSDAPVYLDGEWEFYWQEFISPIESTIQQKNLKSSIVKFPSNWHNYKQNGNNLPYFGYGTYKLKVLLPENCPTLSLHHNIMGGGIIRSYPHILYINGSLVMQDGIPANNKTDSLPVYKISQGNYTPTSTELNITLHMSNYRNLSGAAWTGIFLGTTEQSYGMRETNIQWILVISGALMIMAIYHLGLFIQRKSDKSLLIFAVICFFMTIRNLIMGERLLDFVFPETILAWHFATAFEFLSAHMVLPLFVLFFKKLYPKEIHKTPLIITLIVSGFWASICLFFPATFMTKGLSYFEIFLIFPIIYCLFALINAAKNKREGAIIIVIGLIIITLTSVNDVLLSNEIINSVYLSPLGVFFFIFSQSFLLSLKFSHTFNKIETLSSDLLIANNCMNQLNESYKSFIPYEFLQNLEKDSINDIKVGDQVKKEMAVLFADIRDFTSLSEQMTPQENFKFLNSYFSRVGPVIRSHNGFIDKYIGDGIMGLFEETKDAVLSIIDFFDTLKIYNQHRGNSNYKEIEVGIGLATGDMIMGIVGEEKRMEGTVISDSVNLSSRLEGLTKMYKVRCILSENTAKEVKDHFLLRCLDNVKVIGRSKPEIIYQLCQVEQDEVSDKIQYIIEPFQKALALYKNKDFYNAMILFQECLEIIPTDSPSILYIERCKKNIANGVPADWQWLTNIALK